MVFRAKSNFPQQNINWKMIWSMCIHDTRDAQKNTMCAQMVLIYVFHQKSHITLFYTLHLERFWPLIAVVFNTIKFTLGILILYKYVGTCIRPFSLSKHNAEIVQIARNEVCLLTLHSQLNSLCCNLIEFTT